MPVVQTVPFEIGGGRVRRPFTKGGEKLLAGHEMTAEEIYAIPITNRRVLIEKGFLQVWPCSEVGRKPRLPANAKRHIVPLGFGRYDVVEGVKLNDGPIDAAEVERLTGQRVGKLRAEDVPAATELPPDEAVFAA